MKTPKFWYQQRQSFVAKSLKPIAFLYEALSALRLQKTKRANCRVICIGGLVAGGSGKTPTPIAIRKLLEKGAFLIRGYGGSLKKPALVDLQQHSYCEVGDEALLLAKHAATAVARNRAQGANLLRDEALIIMDDGLYNKSLHKDVSIIVIDASVGIGNGLTIPAGALRRPLSQGLALADAIIIIGAQKADLPHFNVPVFRANLEIETVKNGNFVAFAGLGRPLKFKESLLAAGVALKEFIEFPDHHPYTARDMKKITKKGARFITTEKDFVRIPAEFQSKIEVARARLVFEKPDELRHFLTNAL